ncbi:uncharacterized protein ColSpa_04882 [Colletotrichum spaethianum]|uniref:Modin n=1 Tax=Colletotrichum spaethianum TaxID=700344 RepID=A0AA37LA98_9PEZI|nr:uncharacterized protein ColSpa_04882 [Colletotrichum spaethianum]GKT44701.1 hypothetical protein ColSpa_04882 [Colletotrichum spaethianum]
MSSNNTNDGGGGTGGGDDNQVELIVAIVALVISVFAFIIAIFQALQQYYASATGYSSCTPKVMGDWARFTRRRFRWYEFRFEVEFEVPVIFVAPPTNHRGPLGLHEEKEITYMTGTSDSYKKTFTWDQRQYDEVDKSLRAGNSRQAIHTADNELANWLGLLMAIQRMERESRTWQDNEYFGHNNPQWEDQTPCHPHAPTTYVTYSLTVGMQRKKKSWDSMPDNLKKPYATTTITHIVEIAGMLGVHWKEFNRNEDRYRAQGNGFSITGYDVDDLGIVFTFKKTGPTWFHENRVVPNNRVKELCFGYCPTIFRKDNSNNHKYADEPKDIGTLQLGIAFEILGMLGVVLQIPGTAFRMLPNPTIWHWDRKAFSLRTFLGDYVHAMSEASANEPRLKVNESSCVGTIIKDASKIEDKFLELESRDGPEAVLRPTDNTEERIYSNDLVMALHSAIARCDEFLTHPSRINLVQNVLRVHLQEILRILNDTDGEYKAVMIATRDKSRANKDHLSDFVLPGASSSVPVNEESEEVQKEISLLQKLDSASSSERHSVLADIYLFSVRKRVIEVVCKHMLIDKARRERGPRSIISTASGEPQRYDQEQQINDVWCMLVFRMICWLLLHDFHGKDIQVEKSDAFGSRLSVYIT